jgi:hypothetical protein
MISAEDLHLFKLAGDHREAIAEVLQFFRIYHSMRYVKHQLVLRLNQPLAPSLVDAFNANFSDILASGRFEQREALPLEHDDPDLLAKPRLVLHFNRRNFGRLRQLIDAINRGSVE